MCAEMEKVEEDRAREVHEDNEEEGAVKPRYSRPISRPSREEVDSHMITHIPYRSWCPYCVRGKSKASAHRRADKQEGQVPIVSIDYMYMEMKGEETERGMPILVMRDSESKWISSTVVPHKGRRGYAIKRLKKDLEALGHRKMKLRSDQEPAILVLKEQVRMREEKILRGRAHQHTIAQAMWLWSARYRRYKAK